MNAHTPPQSSKRGLYQPAMEGLSVGSGKKKTRKPLVQGKLVSETDSGILTDSGSYSNSTSRFHSHNDDTIDNVETDPTLSPMRTVPRQTEYSSPRPEAPSISLDLSDLDIDPKESLTGKGHAQQNVVVYNASHDGSSSPHSSEVSLSVTVISSPARVVCHAPNNSPRNTPLKNGQVRNSSIKTFSPLAVTVNGPHSVLDRHNKESPMSVRISRNGKSDSLARTLFADDEDDGGGGEVAIADNCGICERDDDDEVYLNIDRNDSRGMHISHTSKGIIQEILAEEMEGAYISVVSSPNRTAEVECSSMQISSSESLKNKADVTAKTASEPGFTNDYSLQDTSSGLESSKDSVRSSVARKQKDTIVNASSNKTSGSAKPRVKTRKQVPSRLVASANAKANSSTPYVPPGSVTNKMGTTTKGTKPSALNDTKAAYVISKHKLDRGSNSVPNLGVRNLVKGPKGKASGLKVGSNVRQSTPRIKPVIETSQFSVKGEAVGGGSVDNKDALQRQKNGSNLSKDNTKLITADAAREKREDSKSLKSSFKVEVDHVRGAGDGVEGKSLVTEMDLDMAYTRNMQWLFLVSRARKDFKNQQCQATAQLNALWKIFQAKQREHAQLEEDNTHLRTLLQLDTILDEQESVLPHVVERLPAVKEDHDRLVSALDGTRHQLPVSDIYLPSGGSDNREAMEERLATNLADSEHTLKTINDLVSTMTSDSEKQSSVSLVSQYSACIEAIEAVTSNTLTEIKNLEKELEKLTKVNTQLTSLMIHDMKR